MTVIISYSCIKGKSYNKGKIYSKGKDESYGKVYVEDGRVLETKAGRLGNNVEAMASLEVVKQSVIDYTLPRSRSYWISSLNVNMLATVRINIVHFFLVRAVDDFEWSHVIVSCIVIQQQRTNLILLQQYLITKAIYTSTVVQEAYHVQLLQIDPNATIEMVMAMIIEEAAVDDDVAS